MYKWFLSRNQRWKRKDKSPGIKASRYEAQGIVLNKCFPLYFTRTANNAILYGGYLLLHYHSVSID